MLGQKKNSFYELYMALLTATKSKSTLSLTWNTLGLSEEGTVITNLCEQSGLLKSAQTAFQRSIHGNDC